MDGSARREAALLLARCRRGGARLTALPAELQPADEAEAYDLQDTLHDELSGGAPEGSGLGPIVGHKIGCTTPVMQRFLNIHNPCAGGIFEATVWHGNTRFDHGEFHRVGVECEIAVRLGTSLSASDAPFNRPDVAAAVGAVMAAFEVVDDRYEDFRAIAAPSLIADDFFNAAAVLGDPVTDWRDLDLAAIEGVMRLDGVTVGEGCGGDVLGHPLEALVWLANLMASRGRDLPAGAFVLLGSVVETVWPARGQSLEIVLSGLGGLSVSFD